MVVASVNPHAPWNTGDPSVYDPENLKLPPHFIDTRETRESYSRYLAEVTLLDEETGKVMDKLKEQGVYDNSLIFFLSEQGSQFVGNKWNVWNPGVHAGMIAVWNNIIKPGTSTNALVQYEDILPTFIDLAGGKIPDSLDGFSMLGLLKGEKNVHRKYAFSLHHNIPEGSAYPIRSVTDGKYKLIWNLMSDSTYINIHMERSPWYLSWLTQRTKKASFILDRYKHRPEFELYNIENDPFELINLYNTDLNNDVFHRLKAALDEWMISQGDRGKDMDNLQNPGIHPDKITYLNKILNEL
jgi:arylsulfatase A-like enzyme